MKVEQLQYKLKAWSKKYPRAVNRAIKKLLTDIKAEAYKMYSGSPIKTLSTDTRAALTYKADAKNMSGRVWVGGDRTFIAIFHETKNRPRMRYERRPVWEPLKKKYNPQVAVKMLNQIMKEYR